MVPEDSLIGKYPIWLSIWSIELAGQKIAKMVGVFSSKPDQEIVTGSKSLTKVDGFATSEVAARVWFCLFVYYCLFVLFVYVCF